jgi:hypothetical protein
MPTPLRLRWLLRSCASMGQRHGEGRALAEGRSRPGHVPAVALDRVADDRQAEAGAPRRARACGVDPVEALEDARQVLLTHADAGVRDRRTCAADGPQRDRTEPPSRLYLTAFETRFFTIASRSADARDTRAVGESTSIAIPRPSARGSCSATTRRTSSARSTGTRSSGPATSRRRRSRSSPTSRASRSLSSFSRLTSPTAREGSSSRRVTASASPRVWIAVTGVFSSCEALTTKSRRRSSMRRSSVRSVRTTSVSSPISETLTRRSRPARSTSTVSGSRSIADALDGLGDAGRRGALEHGDASAATAQAGQRDRGRVGGLQPTISVEQEGWLGERIDELQAPRSLRVERRTALCVGGGQRIECARERCQSSPQPVDPSGSGVVAPCHAVMRSPILRRRRAVRAGRAQPLTADSTAPAAGPDPRSPSDLDPATHGAADRCRSACARVHRGSRSSGRSAKRYPMPRTVWISCGSCGSDSMRPRSLRMCTSSVFVSPT